MKSESPVRYAAAFAIAVGALLLLVAYFGAYCGMHRPDERNVGDVIPGTGRYELHPIYRWDTIAVRIFFGPAHEVDRRLLPDRWSAELTISE